MAVLGGRSDRGRLRKATVVVVARSGFQQATVGAVVRAAGVPRERFYVHYSTLAECYEDALTPLRAALWWAARCGAETADESIEQFERSLMPVLRLLAEDEELTYCLLFEPAQPRPDPTFSDSPAREALVAIIDRLLDGHGAPAADAYAAMLHQLIQQRVIAGEAAALPGLARTFGDLLRTHRAGLEQQQRRRDAG